jgi:hypothetical protein
MEEGLMSRIPKIGELFAGRYRIEDLLQQGQQTATVQAIDERSNSMVVIKLPAMAPSEPGYQREAARLRRSAALRFGSPWIVDSLELIDQPSLLAAVFPYVDGVDLRQYVAQHGGRLSVMESVQIASALAAGLSALHARGVIHRDLKPDNTVIDSSDGGPRIIDLGLARVAHEPTISDPAVWVGSLGYMPPEQMHGGSAVDHRADLFALGAILFFTLTGQSPLPEFDANDASVVMASWAPVPPSTLVAGVPPDLDRLVLRLLARRPDDRYSSASEVARDLRQMASPGATGCPSCAEPLSPNGRFCGRCGLELAAYHRRAVRCLACGGACDERASACAACGRGFDTVGHRLVIERGVLAGTTFRIPHGEYSTGREQLCPRDQFMSRRQLIVSACNGTVSVRDGGGTNTTLVDRHPVSSSIPLQNGSLVHMGACRAVYQRA